MNKQPHNKTGTMESKRSIEASLRQQRFSEARTLAAELSKKAPKDPDAWLLLGIANSRLGDWPEAERSCIKSIHLQARNPWAHYTLATVYQAIGKIPDAVQSYRQAVKLKPDYAEALNNLGSLLRSLQHLQEAQKHLEKAARILPGNPVVVNNIGLVYKDQGELADAVRCFRKAIESQPGYADAHLNLGNTLQLQGDAAAATGAYRQALEARPDYPLALAALAHQLSSQGETDEAIALFERALHIQPDFPEALAGIAAAREKLGDPDGAYQALQPLMAQTPPHTAAVITFGTICRRIKRQEEAIILQERQLRLPGMPVNLMQELHFGLGDLYDDIGRHDDAFLHYRAANDMQPWQYNEELQRAQFEAIRTRFTARTLPSMNHARFRSDRPVFIVGMPRSGTSLVEQILAAHPDVHGGGELSAIGDLLNSFPARFRSRGTYPAAASTLSTAEVDELARTYLARLDAISPAALRVTDKMPHNFMHLGIIQLMFPDARIIHCVRDPRDTCLSIYFHKFNANHPYSSDLARLGRYYRRYQELMGHWKQVLELPLLEVSYEHLVNGQEEQSRLLVEFCGLEWDPGCLQFHTNTRLVNTPSYAQVRQPIYRSSLQRWKSYERHIGDLCDALKQR